MMRCLRLSSLLIALLVTGCRSPYRSLVRRHGGDISVLTHTPQFKKELYRCHINGRLLFRKYHLSGILLFKNFGDSTRVIFQNEMGYSFFDFGWDGADNFTVNSILPQLNKPAIIRTLQKDFELLLYRRLKKSQEEFYGRATRGAWENETRDMTGKQLLVFQNQIWHRFPLAKGYVFYMEDWSWTPYTRLIETTGGRRPVTTMHLTWPGSIIALPDSVTITHRRAHFTVAAKKIDTTNAE